MTLTSCTVDLARLRVLREGRTVDLTAREADLLRYLSANPSRTVSRDELLSEVWGYADSVVSRACDNTVRRLREKIEADPSRPDHLLTVHGTGYRFEPTPAPAPAPAVAPASSETWVTLGPVRVGVATRRIVGPEGEHRLTEQEAAVLDALLAERGAVVSHADLASAGWGREDAPVVRAIHALRRKLGPNVALESVRGDGYRLAIGSSAPSSGGDLLIGRAALLEEARVLARTTSWLLLVGAGGAGKSRLARELAGDAVWVDLATADSAEVAAARVARAMGLVPGSGDAIEQVGQRLERMPASVVLDNLEPLGDSAIRLINRWRVPGVRLLGTSRRRLGAAGEVVVEVGPLSRADAIALFEARARAASPAFRAAPVDREAIGEVVDRIDRLPLAIELLAARTTVLALEDLRRRVGAELLVRPSSRDPRHHSVEALVHESITSLPTSAQQDLAQLAPFRSGFTVDDAEAVLGPDAVDRLQVLRDHSLLQRLADRDGHARFDTWQLVHEVLDRAPDPVRIRRYCERMARWGDRPEHIGLVGDEAELDRIAASVEELEHAADAALRLGDPELAARCAIPALVVLLACGPFATGLALADRVLAAGPPDGAAAWILFSRAQLLRMTGRMEAALEALNTCVVIAERADALRQAARAWTTIGTLQHYYGLPGARSSLDEAARAWARLPDAEGWDALCDARSRWVDGDGEGTRAASARAVAAANRSGNRDLLAMASTLMGEEAMLDGRLAEAQAAFDAEVAAAHFALHRVVAVGHRMDLALAALDPDGLERWMGEFERAAEPVAGAVTDAWLLRARAAVAGLREQWDEADRAMDQAEACHVGLATAREALVARLVRIELARRRGDGVQALALIDESRDRFARFDAISLETLDSEAGLARLAVGDVAGSRALLTTSTPCTNRVNRPIRIAWQALLSAAEGDREGSARSLAELAHELRRSGSPTPNDDPGRVERVVGRWARALL